MGLKIWLPLNNSITNMGNTSSVSFTILSNNTTTNSNGLIGGCYSNNSNTAGGMRSSTVVSLGQKQSMSCWFKFNSLMSASNLGGSLVNQHRYPNNTGMGLTIKYVSSTTGYLSVNTGNGSSRTYNTYCGTTLLQANRWYHACYTYDNGTLKIYVNGVCEYTGSIGAQSVPADYITVFCWSMDATSGTAVHANYKLNGYLNDVRVYDHTLSAEEVAAIARTPNNYLGNSLQVWAPLTSMTVNSTQNSLCFGTTRNQGTSGSSITATAVPPIQDNGKVGKCIAFNGTSSRLQGTYKSSANITFALWLYFDEVTSGHVFDARTADATSGYQPIYVTPTTMQFGNTGTSFPDINYTWSAGRWYHICVTHDYNQGKVYIDGNLVATNTSAGGRDLGTCNFNIGCRCSTTSFTKIRVNDVRIYNSTLTAEEVKNLSRGLCLHYRLDNNMWSGNLLPNVDTGSGWSYSTFDNEWYEYTRSTTSTSENYISTGGYNVAVTSGKIYTLSCWAKSNGYVSSMDMYKYNSSVQNIQARTGISLTTDYQLYTWTFTANATENVIIRFDNNGTTSSGTTATLTIREPILEEGPISSLKSQTTTSSTSFTYTPPWYCYVQDSSGMGNHGNAYGGWTWTGTTPKYKAAAFFCGKSNAIQIPDLSKLIASDGIFTFSVWIFKGDWGSDSWETILGGPSGFELEGKISNTQNNYIHPYSWGGGSTTTPNSYSFQYSFSQWHMVTMVRTPSNTKFYLDGQLKVTGTAGTIPSGNYFIGSWKDFVSQNFRGWMCDARIYSTALTDAEVLALYNKLI